MLATVLLLTSAGCGGLPGAGAPGTRTITPAPIPGDEPTPTTTGARLAPGLSPTGVENASALAGAHERVLDGQSYTVSLTNTVRYANGTLRTQTRTRLELAADRTRARYASDSVDRRATTPSVTRVRVWRTRAGVVRLVRTNETVCRFSSSGPAPGPDVESAGQPTIERLLSVTTPNVTAATRGGGRALYRLHWTGTAAPGSAGPRRLVALTVVVDARGLVNWYEATYRLTRGRDTVTIVREVRFVNLGETEVERPAWVETLPRIEGCVSAGQHPDE